MLSNILDWFSYPDNSDGTPIEWFGGLVLILIASFFWIQVISKFE